MKRLTALMAAFGLVLAACAGDDATDTTEPDRTTSTTDVATTTSSPSTTSAPTTSTTPPTTTTTTNAPTTTTSESPGAELDATCTSPDGFSVAYPGDWETNDGEVVAECTMFDPNAFTVPQGTDERVAAINIYLENVKYSTLADSIASEGLVSRDATTVDGHDAIRVEHEVEDNGILPEGTLVTSYYIDVGAEQQALVADTIDLRTIDYREATRILDRMVDTVDLDVPITSGVLPIGDFMAPPVESSDYPASGAPARMTDVRFGVHEGFDRVVFEFDDATNFSYSVEYVEEAIPASGDPIDVTGEAILSVTMQPASGVDLSGDDVDETYTGPERIGVSGVEVTELVQVEDFENVLAWAIGLDNTPDVALSTLEDPHRLVIDIANG